MELNNLYYNINIYNDYFMFRWEKLINNISPTKMPTYIMNYNKLLSILVSSIKNIIENIEEAHNLPKNNFKDYGLDVIKDYFKYLILSHENKNFSKNKSFKESFPNNYYSKLVNEYEPNRSFLYLTKMTLNEISFHDLNQNKFIGLVLPIIEQKQDNIHEMSFCLFILQFDNETLSTYIDNIHHLNYFS